MQLLLRYRRWFLAGLVLVTGFLALSLGNLRVDFSFDRFLPKDEPHYKFYQAYKEVFPHYDNGIQIALHNGGNDIWDLAFLRGVDSLFRDLRTLPHLDTVISPTELQVYRRSGMGVSARDLFDLRSEKGVEASRKRLARDSLLFTNFFTTGRSHVAGMLLMDPGILDKPLRDSVNGLITAKLESSGMDYIVSGVPYVRTQYVSKIRDELFWFIGFSVVLALVVMFLLYRNWWGMLLPQAGVILALIWTLGLMGLTGKSLDMVSELLPSIIFVVGIADIIHLFTRYQQDLHRGLPRKKAMLTTLREIGLAIFLTSFTTAIGFASLLVSPMPPIRELGVFAAIGVLFAYIIAIVLIPNALMAINAEKVRKSRGWGNSPRWERYLHRLHDWVAGNGPKIIAGFVLLIAVAGYGISRISLDTYLLDDMSERDPARASMRFFEENFYGSRPFEMAIIPRDGRTLTDPEVLRDIDRMQEFLHTQERFSPFLSVVTYLKGVNRLYHGGRDKHFRLPRNAEKTDELIGFGYSSGAEDVLDLVMDRERRIGRVSARMGDIGTEKFGRIRDALAEFVRNELRPLHFDYTFTGTAILNERNVKYLRESLFTGLGMAFGLIALLMGLLFRSWRMVLIGMLPNVIPLVITAGAMGFLGISLRASTSIVFLVAFGIAVDDTIHFLSRLRVELKEGRDIETALRNTTVGTGKALVLTTIVLLSGFVFLLSSDFGGTYVVGLFTALTLLVALLSDLLLVPVLVRWTGIK